jgi:EF-P beta-lysylation protein EpmB
LASWQAALQAAVRDPAELLRLLELSPAALGAPANVAFPLLVPRGFVARMRKGDPHDPLLRQVWPHAAELRPVAGFTADPVREQERAAQGVLRKYAGRVLLIASAACPLHCRYCFRRDFPYSAQLAARADWTAALAELHAVPDAREVILSGGDPLSLSNRRLGDLVARLADTPVTTLRIHTRFPIAVPERVDAGLLRVLRGARLNTVLVVHANHANELDAQVERALSALRTALTALLNQSVLLRGVNDAVDPLAALSERLFACGALPYYLHLLDRVAGAAHFDVDERTASELVAALRARLPGYLVPRLVREVPGELSKTPIA